mgnify:CR=1 FL=1|tara:strand:- start:1828 stop:2607 length:780 start_codon:yes stop_codon:yes gene_type:complete
MDSLSNPDLQKPDFLEVAPENWIGVGGRFGSQFRELAAEYPIVLHGLSLNIGGFTPLDTKLLISVKNFIRDFDCPLYSEHLTYCADKGHIYDLLPIPFSEESVSHVAARVRQVQDILEQTIVLENASYYAAPDQKMSESQFITAVLEESDCSLLLDVNNIYVNSINHNYNASEFLQSLPLTRVKYMHVAGHFDEADDLKVDTHGEDVVESVWELLAEAYKFCGVLPTLLERDFNIPPLVELMSEVEHIRNIQTEILIDC